jgi:flagella basal body P-ring formation protein FlgA
VDKIKSTFLSNDSANSAQSEDKFKASALRNAKKPQTVRCSHCCCKSYQGVKRERLVGKKGPAALMVLAHLISVAEDV